MEQSSGAGRNFQSSFHEKVFLLLFSLLLINTFVNLFITKPNIFDLVRLSKLNREMDEKIKREIKENLRLRALYEEIRRNPKEVKERFIREYLFKIKEGEKIYIIE
ncbi:MAG: hypothetical protein DSY42_05270 [Aquifex sp.]|nr:MAG: hypothetical protein DSY42_05270 [Aquifex sp.]